MNVDKLVEFIVKPITDSVRRQPKMRLMEEERKKQLRVYNILERVEDLRNIAGLLFEAMAQLQLQDVALV